MKLVIAFSVLFGTLAIYIARKFPHFEYSNLTLDENSKPQHHALMFKNSKQDLWLSYYEWDSLLHSKTPKGVVILLHGLGEYTGSPSYHDLIKKLNENQFSVYGFDYEGHGHSQGFQGYVRDFQDYVNDVRAFVARMKVDHSYIVEKKVPVYLFGYSMGGLIAEECMRKTRGEFAGAVLSSPAFSNGHPIFQSQVTTGIFNGMASFAPTLMLPGGDGSFLSHNIEEANKCLEDPLSNQKGFSAHLMSQMAFTFKDAMLNAHNVQWPYLLLHGDEDLLCPINGSVAFHSETSSMKKKFIRYEQGRHKLILEKFKETYINDIVEWLNERVQEL